MLQTIEVEIDSKGHIHLLEKLPLPDTNVLIKIITLPLRETQRIYEL